jgi:hypothetical protein
VDNSKKRGWLVSLVDIGWRARTPSGDRFVRNRDNSKNVVANSPERDCFARSSDNSKKRVAAGIRCLNGEATAESFMIMTRRLVQPDNSKKRLRARRRQGQENQLTGGGGGDTVAA